MEKLLVLRSSLLGLALATAIPLACGGDEKGRVAREDAGAGGAAVTSCGLRKKQSGRSPA